MYIIEKLIRIYLKLTKKEVKYKVPSNEDNYLAQDIISCKHHFMPIDSTGKIFACSKCGYVVTKNRLKKQN